MLDDELAQVVRIGGGDPQQVVGLAGHMEDREHAGQRAHVLGEGLDLVAQINQEANDHERLQQTSEGSEIDLSVKPANKKRLKNICNNQIYLLHLRQSCSDIPLH